jgi:hypothetical protein
MLEQLRVGQIWLRRDQTERIIITELGDPHVSDEGQHRQPIRYRVEQDGRFSRNDRCTYWFNPTRACHMSQRDDDPTDLDLMILLYEPAG